MKRRTFLDISTKSAIAIGLSPMLFSQCKSNSSNPDLYLKKVGKGNLNFIRGNVSKYNHKGGTVGVLETNEGFVIIDAQFPNSIRPLLKSIDSIEGKPIQYLCNTHHHGDHTAGNIEFKGMGCVTIAHEQVPIFQKLRAEENKDEKKQLYASTLFEKKYEFSSGKHSITAYHFGAAHTIGDAIYHFEKDHVVHLGDIVFQNVLPVYRFADGCNGDSWISVLDKIIDTFNSNTRFIFGHANKNSKTDGNLSDVRKMREFMEDTMEFAQREIVQNNKSVSQLVNEFEAIPGHEDRKPLWDGHWDEFLSNLTASVK